MYTALATSCQVYPSEYAYHDNSVSRDESPSASCRRYEDTFTYSGQYTHCDGRQLKLIDSELGPEQYQSTDYYVWITGSDRKLLFIFPTRVSLTIITLHYYNDSERGLPRLRFYAVQNDFDIWDTLSTNTPSVDVATVPSGGKPAGHRSISININFNTTKVLMYKFSSSFVFALSEVEFFTCKQVSLIHDVKNNTCICMQVK